jgi:tetratricopeptide (TPR) repeat protein
LTALYDLSFRKEDAINFGESMVPVLAHKGDRRSMARVLHELGNTYRTIHNYNVSRKYFVKSLKLFKQLGDQLGEINSTVSLGHSLIALKRHKEASSTLNAIIIKIKKYDQEFPGEGKNAEANAYRAIANNYTRLNDFPKAKRTFEKALSIYSELNQALGEGAVLTDLGQVYLRMKDYPKAKYYLMQAIETARKIGMLITEANAQYTLSRVYYSEKAYDLAILSLQNASTIYREVGDKSLAKETHEILEALTKQNVDMTKLEITNK